MSVTPEFTVAFAKEAMMITLEVSAPMLGVGLIVGILISIFQTITSINEMTLTFVPKIIAVLIAMIIFFPWIIDTMMTFTTHLFQNIPLYVK
jgi:flagellar biosynthetic protein FliQ